MNEPRGRGRYQENKAGLPLFERDILEILARWGRQGTPDRQQARPLHRPDPRGRQS
jgi:hypothetical protein